MSILDDYLSQQTNSTFSSTKTRARDEFAKAAMQTLIMEGIFPTTSSTTDSQTGNTTTSSTQGSANKNWSQVAKDAWDCAEAMMNERASRGLG